MSIINKIRDKVTEPGMKKIDINGSDRIVAEREILFSKKLMVYVLKELYKACMDLGEKYFTAEGLNVEIGAGSSMVKHYYPNVITTDIVPSPYIDKILNAQNMDFEDSSIRMIFGKDCFHHFSQPKLFLKELNRVLKPEGGCILVEPYHGFFASLIFTYLHEPDRECFDKNQKRWDSNKDKASPMSGANQALSYIVFVRDKELFKKKFPSLEIVKILPLKNYLQYLLSGGVTFKQLVPDFIIPGIKFLEWILSPLVNKLAIHYIIVLRKII